MSAKQTISRKEIEKIAHLAKLHLTDPQYQLYTRQINKILEHVQRLGNLDVEGIEPLSHVLDLVNVSSKDETADSLPRDRVLGNVPIVKTGSMTETRATDGEFFLVPEIIKTGP